MKSFFRRLLALLLCVGMLLCFSAVAFGEDEEIKDLNDRLDQLKKEEQALQAKVDAAKTEKAKQEAIKAKTTQEINIMKQQISLLEEKITALEKKIADLELEIEEKEEEIFNLEDDIAETYDLFKRRMRAMYMSEHVSSLSLLLGAESFGDFLTTSEYLKRVAQHDQDIQTDLEQTLANVEAAKAAVEEAKAALEADQEELADTKAEAEETRRQLDAKLSATVAEIQSIEQMEKEFLADIAAKQKEMKETQEEIDRIYAEMEAMSEFVGAPLCFRCQGMPASAPITAGALTAAISTPGWTSPARMSTAKVWWRPMPAMLSLQRPPISPIRATENTSLLTTAAATPPSMPI